MKELARKGLFSIVEMNNNRYIDFGGVMGCLFKVSTEELSDLKDCISQVTAKKWKQKGDGYTLVCPDCENTAPYNIAENFCPNCGLKLEGVEDGREKNG